MFGVFSRLWSCIWRPRTQLAYAPVRRHLPAVVFLASLGAAMPVEAQVSGTQLRTMGLETMWQAQLQMPAEDGRLVSTHLWTNPGVKKTYAELILPAGTRGGSRTLRVAARLYDDDGKPLDRDAAIAEAKREVERRATRMLARAPGVSAVEVSVPMIYLAVVSSDGLVQNYDAETGELLWRGSCGPPDVAAAPGSVSDMGVFVAQGDTLYLLDWMTGKQLAVRKLKRSSSAGVAAVGTVAFVASLSGQLMAYDFSKPVTAAPFTYRLYGRAVTVPASSDRAHSLVAFATENGIASLFYGGEKIGPWFNVEVRAPLSGPLTFIGGSLYLGDIAGQVTKVGLDRLGSVEWRTIIADGIGAPPMLVDKVLYITSEIGNLHAVDDATGFPVWTEPAQKVKSILAATKERLYCRSLTDRLLVVDAQSGQSLSQTQSLLVGHDVVNHLNDRLYILSSGGSLQCVRQGGPEYVMPVFHEPLPAATEAEQGKPKANAGEAAEMPAEGADPAASPFGASDNAGDPFGAAATEPPPADTSSDPFASPNASPF